MSTVLFLCLSAIFRVSHEVEVTKGELARMGRQRAEFARSYDRTKRKVQSLNDEKPNLERDIGIVYHITHV